MKIKKIKVLSVVFFAAIILVMGIGIITVQVYRVPEQGYLALGMILLNQNGESVGSITGLSPETIAKIENNSLTPNEIPKAKDKIQNSLNQGFQKWTKQNSIKFTSLNATSETVTPLFFKFLEENQKYKEAFKLYDKVLTQENDYKIQELTKTILSTDVNYVVQNGELLKQWNTTTEVNGTTYTSMFNEYSLNINGTTLTAVEVTVMTSDGTVISDPYLYVHKVDLFYLQFVVISWWPFWGIYIPIYYGYDIYSYMRYSNNPSDAGYSEAALFLAKAESDLKAPGLTLGTLSGYLAIAAFFLAKTGVGAPAAAMLFERLS